MPEFRFSETETFKSNLDSFFGEMEELDPEMGRILRAHHAKLLSITQDGKKDTQMRTAFMNAVLSELEKLNALMPAEGEEP